TCQRDEATRRAEHGGETRFLRPPALLLFRPVRARLRGRGRHRRAVGNGRRLEGAVPRRGGLLPEGGPGTGRAPLEHLGAGGRRASAHRGARPAHGTGPEGTAPTMNGRTNRWTAL